MAAVVTQLYAYMLDIGVRFGYLSTGEGIVFVQIDLRDPSQVWYHLCIPPGPDGEGASEEDAEASYQQTLVAEVFAFLLHAMAVESVEQAWFERARQEGKEWEVQTASIEEVLPESHKRATTAEASKYSASEGGSSLRRTTLQTRRQVFAGNDSCQGTLGPIPRPDSSGSDDEHGASSANSQPSPLRRVQTRSRTAATKRPISQSQSGKGRPEPTADEECEKQTPSNSAPLMQETDDAWSCRIRVSRRALWEERFCTHTCLRGVTHAEPVDPSCPNAHRHRDSHPSLAEFLAMVRLEMHDNVERACLSLHAHGSTGSLLKMCLPRLGYVFVAKGVPQHKRQALRHEHEMYRRALPIQGVAVPVCVGRIALVQRPYYLGLACQLRHLLILSWAGRSLNGAIEDAPWLKKCVQASIQKRFAQALALLHRQSILHRDLEPRNVMYDSRTGLVMIVDLERAHSDQDRKVLGELTTNRKRKAPALKGPRNPGSLFDAESTKSYAMMQAWAKTLAA